MEDVRWSRLKSERLKKTRGASFEDLVSSELVCRRRNPARENQKMLLFKYKDYIWIVPYVEASDHIFLKTLFPSRKYTKLYKKGVMP